MRKNILICLFLGFVLYSQSTGPLAGPNRYNSGIVTLTNAAVTLTTYTTNVVNIHCANTTGSAVTFTLTNNAGIVYFPTVSIPANSVMVAHYGDTGLTMLGIKWNADSNSALNCQITGRQ